MTFQIVEGLPKGLEAQAADLYWQAFGEKLGKLMGPGTRARAFFADTLHPASVIAACDGEVLLGIAAFKSKGKGFSDAGMGDLWRHYGVGSLWRVVPLAMLERTSPDTCLQMDGICVDADARGRGVGSALFDALFAMAKREGFAEITLDVIDRNHRARALYERLGFVAGETSATGPLRHLLGFDHATKMVRPV